MLRNKILTPLLAASALALTVSPAYAGKEDRAKQAIAAAEAKIETAKSMGVGTEMPQSAAEAQATLLRAKEDLKADRNRSAIDKAIEAQKLADAAIGEMQKRKEVTQQASAEQAAAAQDQAAQANARAAAAEQAAASSAAEASAARNAAAMAAQTPPAQVETTVTTQQAAPATHHATRARVTTRKTATTRQRAAAAPTTTTTTTVSQAVN